MTHLEIVRDLYDAFGVKDNDRIRRLLAADVEWIQCAGFPGGGHRRGVDEVLDKVLGGLQGEWQDMMPVFPDLSIHW